MPSPNWSQRALASVFEYDTAGSDPTLPMPGLVTGPSGFIIVPAAAGFGITLHTSTWLVAGAAPSTVGSALWCPPGDVTTTVNAADPTFNRNDLVTLQVTDPGSSTTAGQTDVVIVPGTAASTPTDPTVPTGALVIARIVVRAGSSTIVQNDITPLWIYTKLRVDKPAPGWEIRGLNGSGPWNTTNNVEWHYQGGTIIDQQDVTLARNPAQATIIVPGVYHLAFGGTFLADGSTGLRKGTIKVARGGVDFSHIADADQGSNSFVWMSPSAPVRLNAGDTVTPVLLQQSGGTLGVDDSDLNFRFTGRRISP